MKNDSKLSQLMPILLMIVSGFITLTDDQISSIIQIIMSSGQPLGLSMQMPMEGPVDPSGTVTVKGMTELAEILGVSVPTACKLSKSGRFDAARLYFGTKKFVWDRAKLLEIARQK